MRYHKMKHFFGDIIPHDRLVQIIADANAPKIEDDYINLDGEPWVAPKPKRTPRSILRVLQEIDRETGCKKVANIKGEGRICPFSRRKGER